MQDMTVKKDLAKKEDAVHQNIPLHKITLTQEEIDFYIAHKENEGLVKGSIEAYRRSMQLFYQNLPEDKVISKDTISVCVELLKEQGYAIRTINAFISVANNYLEYKGLREYQLIDKRMTADNEEIPEITRAEYLRLLGTAKALGRERVYLLVKVFACTGIQLQEIPKLTVEAVKEKKVVITPSGVKQLLRIPDLLCEELLSYANRKGILSGPVFLTRKGLPMARNNITGGINQLGQAANVPLEKTNPRCLRKLYLSTYADIEANISLLIEKEYTRRLEEEQQFIGWEKA